VNGIDKPANTTCRFQKFHKGCTVYHTAEFPVECGLWNCRWLINDDASDLSRPDRSHYVLDILPDFITMEDNATGTKKNMTVVQVWIDPRYPEAHRDSALREWVARRAQDGIGTLVRTGSRDAFLLLAPPFCEDGQWHEIRTNINIVKPHSAKEIFDSMTGA
jgi:hypothetical protein